MPQDSNYWDKFWRRRMGRRRLISGAALTGTGLAAAAVVGCGGEEAGSPGGSPGTNGNGNGPDVSAGQRYLELGYEQPVDGRHGCAKEKL